MFQLHEKEKAKDLNAESVVQQHSIRILVLFHVQHVKCFLEEMRNMHKLVSSSTKSFIHRNICL